MARLPVHTRPASGSTDVGAVAGGVASVFGRTGAVVAAASDYDASQVDNDSSVAGATVKDALNTLLSADATLTAAVAGKLGATAAAGGDLSGNYPNPNVAKLNNITLDTGPLVNETFVYDGSSQYELRAIGTRIWQWNGTDVTQFDAQFDVVGAAGGGATTFASYTADATLPRGGKMVMGAAATGKKAAVMNITQTFALGARYRVECIVVVPVAGSTNRHPGLWFLGDGSTPTTYSGFFAGVFGNGGSTSAYVRCDSGHGNGSSLNLSGGSTPVGTQQRYHVTYELNLKSYTWYGAGMRVFQSPTHNVSGSCTHSDLLSYSATTGAIVAGTRTKLGIGLWHQAASLLNANVVEFLDLEVWRIP